MAPELENACRRLPKHVSLPSLNRPHKCARAHHAACYCGGPTGFTHLGNGCPVELKRDDNILWRALDTPDLMYSLIPTAGTSARPVSNPTQGNRPKTLYYTTDAMAAAGSVPGKSLDLELEVGPEESSVPRHAQSCGSR